MDSETKNVLIVVGLLILVLYLVRPRVKPEVDPLPGGNPGGKDRVKAPNEGSDKEFQCAVISIRAMREAINCGEPKQELDKLNRLLMKENGIKVYSARDGKLKARNAKGIDIAQEQ